MLPVSCNSISARERERIRRYTLGLISHVEWELAMYELRKCKYSASRGTLNAHVGENDAIAC
jgi:hypothetical protein